MVHVLPRAFSARMFFLTNAMLRMIGDGFLPPLQGLTCFFGQPRLKPGLCFLGPSGRCLRSRRYRRVSVLAIGYWLLAIGYWLLAIGYRCVDAHEAPSDS
jgi:hypothetical protein